MTMYIVCINHGKYICRLYYIKTLLNACLDINNNDDDDIDDDVNIWLQDTIII